MPDLLDMMLQTIALEKAATDTVLIKTTEGFQTLTADALEVTYGELTEIERRTIGTADGQKEIPVYEQKATDEEKKAQKDRSSKYGIAVKPGGSITVPKKWADKGLSFDDFGDPVNCKFPLHDESHVKLTLDPDLEEKNALARWGNEDIRKQYSSSEQSVVKGRIDDAAKKFKVEPSDNPKNKSTQLIGGESFVVSESQDRLGRTTYVFQHGTGDNLQTLGFVRDGNIASLRVPQATGPDEVRRLMSILTQNKSVGDGEPKSFADHLKAAGDMGYGEMNAAWYAFVQSVAGGDHEDASVYRVAVNDLAQALLGVYSRSEDAGTSVPLMTATMDAAHTLRKNEKAGATISRANRDKLRRAVEMLHDLLGDDAPKNAGDGDAKNKGFNLDSGNVNVEAIKAAVGGQLNDLRADLKRMSDENAELRRTLDARGDPAGGTGKEPRPDPMNAPPKHKSVTTGNTIYDLVPGSNQGA